MRERAIIIFLSYVLFVFIQTPIVSCLTNEDASTDNLPPTLVAYQSPNFLFSGFRQSVVFNGNTSTTYPIIADLEEACSLSPNDLPFYPRLFVHELAGSYYYCPRNKSLLILNPYQNFTATGSYINLSNLPTFDEVRMKIFLTHPGFITMLGLINTVNTQDKMAKNYTDSYNILISWQLKVVTSSAKIKGVHGEPIVDMEAMFGKVVTVGEKVYNCGSKLNTYYLGNWGDVQFSQVIDFYLSNTYGFIPRIKITIDQQYLLYTSSQALYGYRINTTTIIQTKDSTLVNHTFYKDGKAIYQWQEMPFTVSSLERKLYAYHQGNLTTYSIQSNKDFVRESTIKLAPFDQSTTYSRFYFFKYLLRDEAFIQIGDSTSIIYLTNRSDDNLTKTNEISQ